MVKANLDAMPPSLSFRVLRNSNSSTIQWDGVSDLTADDLVGGAADNDLHPAVQSAAYWWDDLYNAPPPPGSSGSSRWSDPGAPGRLILAIARRTAGTSPAEAWARGLTGLAIPARRDRTAGTSPAEAAAARCCLGGRSKPVATTVGT